MSTSTPAGAGEGRGRAIAFTLPAMWIAAALSLSLMLAQPPARPRELPPAVPLSGLGLLVGAGVSGGLGLAAQIWRISILKGGCDNQFVFPELQVTVTSCVDESLRYLGLSTVAPVFNAAAAGMAAGGGVLRGNYSAWKGVLRDRRQRVAPAFAGAGAGLVVLGLALYVGSRVALWRDRFGVSSCEAANDRTMECVRDRWSSWVIMTAAGQSVAIVGTGLLAYGLSYKRASRFYSVLGRIRVQPTWTPRFVGVGVTARF